MNSKECTPHPAQPRKKLTLFLITGSPNSGSAKEVRSRAEGYSPRTVLTRPKAYNSGEGQGPHPSSSVYNLSLNSCVKVYVSFLLPST